MALTRLRDETSSEGKAIWKDVELAASRAPEWIKARSSEAATAPKQETGGGIEGGPARPRP